MDHDVNLKTRLTSSRREKHSLGASVLPYVTSIPFIYVTFLIESFIPENVILICDTSSCLRLYSNSDTLLHVRQSVREALLCKEPLIYLGNSLVLLCIVLLTSAGWCGSLYESVGKSSLRTLWEEVGVNLLCFCQNFIIF